MQDFHKTNPNPNPLLSSHQILASEVVRFLLHSSPKLDFSDLLCSTSSVDNSYMKL